MISEQGHRDLGKYTRNDRYRHRDTQHAGGWQVVNWARLAKMVNREVEAMKVTGRSIMPDGLLDKMTDGQVRDLFAYLRTAQPLNDR